MALAKEVVLDRLEVDEVGVVFLRFASYITEDGARISSPTFHRVTYAPGDPLPAKVPVDGRGTHIDMPARVTEVTKVVWTPEVIKAQQDRMAAVNSQLEAQEQARLARIAAAAART